MKNKTKNNQSQPIQEIINTSSENLEVLSKKKVAEEMSKFLESFQNKTFHTDNYIFDFQAYSKEDENMLLTGQFPLKIFIRLKNKDKKRLDIIENFFDWFITLIEDDLEKSGLKLNFSTTYQPSLALDLLYILIILFSLTIKAVAVSHSTTCITFKITS